MPFSIRRPPINKCYVIKEIVLRIVFNIRNAYHCNNWRLIAKSPITKMTSKQKVSLKVIVFRMAFLQKNRLSP